MADEKDVQEIKERPWVSYIIGVVILFIIGFFVFGGSLPWTKKGQEEKKNQEDKKEVSVTIEGIINQEGKDKSLYIIESVAGFNNLIYNKDTKFTDSLDKTFSKESIKNGMKIRAEGRPNGKSFEAKKIIVFTEQTKATPTPFILPGTGITE